MRKVHKWSSPLSQWMTSWDEVPYFATICAIGVSPNVTRYNKKVTCKRCLKIMENKK